MYDKIKDKEVGDEGKIEEAEVWCSMTGRKLRGYLHALGIWHPIRAMRAPSSSRGGSLWQASHCRSVLASFLSRS